jgi:hypothetical protein
VNSSPWASFNGGSTQLPIRSRPPSAADPPKARRRAPPRRAGPRGASRGRFSQHAGEVPALARPVTERLLGTRPCPSRSRHDRLVQRTDLAPDPRCTRRLAATLVESASSARCPAHDDVSWVTTTGSLSRSALSRQSSFSPQTAANRREIPDIRAARGRARNPPFAGTFSPRPSPTFCLRMQKVEGRIPSAASERLHFAGLFRAQSAGASASRRTETGPSPRQGRWIVPHERWCLSRSALVLNLGGAKVCQHGQHAALAVLALG